MLPGNRAVRVLAVSPGRTGVLGLTCYARLQ